MPIAISKETSTKVNGLIADSENLVLVRAPSVQPLDGVGDYCEKLADVLSSRGMVTRVHVVEWRTLGWYKAVRLLALHLKSINRPSACLQFTPLMWSKRGFPTMVFLILLVLRLRCRSVSLVVHDPSIWNGRRARDYVRGFVQRCVLMVACVQCNPVFLTIPRELVSWTARLHPKRFAFVPVAAAIEPKEGVPFVYRGGWGESPTTLQIAVFGVTLLGDELEDIRRLSEYVAEAGFEVRLNFFGLGTLENAEKIEELNSHVRVHATVLGFLRRGDVGHQLEFADAVLMLRDQISTRRSTFAAAIAHGAVVVGYYGSETSNLVRAAGVVMKHVGDWEGIATALLRLKRDSAWAAEMRRRSFSAYRRHFSWDEAARVYIDRLRGQFPESYSM